MTGDAVFNDGVKAIFGTSSDGLEIYHDGNSYIDDSGIGDLILRANDQLKVQVYSNSHNMAVFNKAGSVDIYYNNSKKFETTDTGATISGKLIVNGDLDVSGTTTTFNSTVVTVDDPVFTVGGDSAPDASDNKDRGIEFRYFRSGESAKVGFFGYSNADDAFKLLTSATNNSEVFSGTEGNLKVGNVLLADGSDSSPSLTFSSDTNTGFYKYGTDQIGITTNGTFRARFTSTGIFEHWTGITLRGGVFKNKDGSESAPSYTFYGDTNSGIFGGTDIIGFSTGGTEAARFDSSGRLGVSSTSPEADIHLGDALVNGFTVDRKTLAVSDVTNGAQIILRGQSPRIWFDTTSSGSGEFYLDNSNLKFFQGTPTTPSSELMRLNSTGLGIGGTPTRELEVTGTGNVYARITAPSASDSAALELNNTNLLWQLKADDTDSDAFKIINNNGTALTIDANKNVGIGGTPSARLEITTASQGDTALQVGFTNSTPNLLVGTSTGSTKLEIANGNYHHKFYSRNASGTAVERLAIEGGSDTANIKIINSNLGIGGTPQSKLHVVGGDIRIDNNQGYLAETAGGGVITAAKMDGSDNLLIADGNFVIDVTGSSELMRLNSTGLGIGATPSAKLHLKNTSADTKLLVETTSGNDAILELKAPEASGAQSHIRFSDDTANVGGITYNHNSSGSDYMQFYTASAERMRINSTGSVSIGNANEYAKLYVQGNSATLPAGRFYQQHATGDGLSISTEGETSSEYALKVDSDGGLKPLIYARADGNVGISTTSPSEKLTIDSGNIQLTNGNYIIFDGPTPKQTKMRSYYDGETHLALTVANSSVLDLTASTIHIPNDVQLRLGGGSDMRIVSESSQNVFSFYNHDTLFRTLTDDIDIIFKTTTGGTTSEIMRLDGSSGNVGIGGVTSPNEQLTNYSASGNVTTLTQVGGSGNADLQLKNNSGDRTIRATADKLWFIDNTDTRTDMVIDGSGNVGIGTSSPDRKVVIDAGSGYPLKLNATQDYILSFARSGTEEWWVKANTSGDLIIHENNADDRLRINAGGNVGIGCSPQKALEISEASTSGGAIMRLTSTGETSANDVVGEIEFYNGDTTDYTPGVMSSIKAIAGPSGGEGHLQFLTNMPSEGADASTVALHIHSNSKVGIATTTPSANADLTLGNGELCMAETTTPTADADFGKIYCKSDNKLYFQDGAGTEHEIAFV